MNLYRKTQEWLQRCIFLPEIDSTNKYAIDLIKAERPIEGTSVMTDYQSEGKGQRGNSWHGEQGQNTAMSIILYPHFLTPVKQFDLNLMAALSIYKALSMYSPSLTIKWPNDIYSEDKKIAGILIHNAIQGSRIDYSVLGIGINVNQADFPSDLPNPTSLRQILGKEIDRDQLQRDIIMHVQVGYGLLSENGIETMREEYMKLLYRRDEEHLYKIDGVPRKGIIRSVQNDGRLLVIIGGTERSFTFGQIEYVI